MSMYSSTMLPIRPRPLSLRKVLRVHRQTKRKKMILRSLQTRKREFRG